MALALLAVIVLVTLASLYLFISHPWWLPALASAQGKPIDHQFTIALICIGVAFVLAQLSLGWLVWRYRGREKLPAAFTDGHTKIEILWILLTSLLFLALAWTGARSWAGSHAMEHATPDNKPVEVEVTAAQFAWYFRYPGPDGVYGSTRPELQDASLGSRAALGLDPQDPASADDIVTAQLLLPVNREVQLTLRAHDVIHSFFVPELRFKQDAVPGMRIPVHFTPTRIGDYEIACAELCGLGHYKMRALMRVVSASDYDVWLAQQEAAQSHGAVR